MGHNDVINRPGPDERAELTMRLHRLGTSARSLRDAYEDAREARDQAIEQADLDGWSLGEISRAVHLTRANVHKIVADRTAARQAAG